MPVNILRFRGGGGWGSSGGGREVSTLFLHGRGDFLNIGEENGTFESSLRHFGPHPSESL